MVFSLVKLAYLECSAEQRLWYNSIQGPVVPVDVRDCCEYLIKARKFALLLTNCQQPDVCLIAADKGHVDCLRVAHVAGMPWNSHTMTAAGNIECLSYAHQNGCETANVELMASFSGWKLSMLQYTYAWQHHFDFPTNMCSLAARFGNVEVLKCLRELGLEWDVSTTAGRRPTTVWLTWITREQTTEQTCAAAGLNGHYRQWIYRSLKYAHRHGCESEVNTLFLALINVKMKCYNYALQNISSLPDRLRVGGEIFE
ncbi:uncharacterized protein LOC132925207 [Rhopalosiphum padi]|uniref:uncharacterized protein LOC132925207 n=1 Tax=Rhopalosiphum padi TaxID=40932 RepID=UPI00298D9E99|nr:uncharacterized protein LOC132925207 [Rhopalosiphum padi]